MRGKLSALFTQNSRVAVAVTATAVIGTVTLIATRAASPSVSIEAEAGLASGSAVRLTNLNGTSGNGAVLFGQDTTSYTQIGISDYLTGATATQDQVNGQYIPGLDDSISLVNQHISNFGVNPKNVIDSLVINQDGTYSLNINYALSLEKRFGSTGVLRDFNRQNIVLTACCNFDNDGRQLITDKNGDGDRTDEDLNETSPRWVNDPGNNNPNTQAYTSQATYDRQVYYKIYAEIVKRVVQQYPNIKYVQVWNEMKGFHEQGFIPVPGRVHDSGENYKKYTVFYNHVYSAVKSVTRPDGSKVEVGGPYVVMRSYTPPQTWRQSDLSSPSWGIVSQEHIEAVKWWNMHKTGADFITLDIKNHNRCNNPNISEGCDAEQNNDPYVRMGKYDAVAQWVRTNISATLPIWWAEWYARKNPIVQDAAPESCWHVNEFIAITSSIVNGKTIWHCAIGTTSNKAYQGTLAERAAIMTTGLIKSVKSQVRTTLIWGTKSHLSDGKYHPLALHKSDLSETEVNRSMKCLKDHFEQGALLFDPQNTNSNIEVLATADAAGNNKWLLMVNKSDQDNVTTNAYGRDFSFSKYQVRCVQP